MRVQVLPRVDVGQAYGLPALHRRASLAAAIAFPSNAPVAVGIVGRVDAGHRLLPAACSEEPGQSQR